MADSPVDHAKQAVTVLSIVTPAILRNNTVWVQERTDGIGEVKATTHEKAIAFGVVLLELHPGFIGHRPMAYSLSSVTGKSSLAHATFHRFRAQPSIFGDSRHTRRDRLVPPALPWACAQRQVVTHSPMLSVRSAALRCGVASTAPLPPHSTVTDFAKFRGWSISQPRSMAQ